MKLTAFLMVFNVPYFWSSIHSFDKYGMQVCTKYVVIMRNDAGIAITAYVLVFNKLLSLIVCLFVILLLVMFSYLF